MHIIQELWKRLDHVGHIKILAHSNPSLKKKKKGARRGGLSVIFVLDRMCNPHQDIVQKVFSTYHLHAFLS